MENGARVTVSYMMCQFSHLSHFGYVKTATGIVGNVNNMVLFDMFRAYPKSTGLSRLQAVKGTLFPGV